MKQETALKIMQEGRNAYLTGSAGAGKTFTLQKFIEWAESKGKNIAITASTGIAATHLGGQTIHSFSGIGIADKVDDAMFEKWGFKKYKAPSIRKTHILVIDEISMLKAEQLNAVNEVFKKVRKKPGAFGGVQVIVCGDFFQLPPISRQGEPETKFAIESEAWSEADFACCYITEQWRQNDDNYNDFLEKVRSNSVNDMHKAQLDERIGAKTDDFDITRLYTRNINVENYNLGQLARLEGTEKRFVMTESGTDWRVDNLKKNCLAPEILRLKKGALVMALKNDPEGEFVNGSVGTVVDFSEDEFNQKNYPIVEFKNGNTVEMYPQKWTALEGETVMAEITQVPLRLAWAITVHKSQGMTLDAAHIDLTKAFEPGMGYVALSRLRSLNDLSLEGYNDLALKVSEKAMQIDEQLRKESEELELMYQ